MNADHDALENRLLAAFAEVPSETASAARDARVAATIRVARGRPPRHVTSSGPTRMRIAAAVAVVLVAAGTGAWWRSGQHAAGPGPGASQVSGTSDRSSPSPQASSSTVRPGCGPVDRDELPTWPDQTPSARASRAADRERIADIPARSKDAVVGAGFMVGVPDRIGDVALVGYAGDQQRVLAYLTAGAYAREMTRAEFLRAGGFILSQTIPGRPDVASVALDAAGTRGGPVTIGPVQGAMVHGDEVSAGLRPFGLYWADQAGQWSLTSSADPVSVLTVARAVACGVDAAMPPPRADPTAPPSTAAAPGPSGPATTGWGPLAVADDPAVGALDAGTGPGELVIGQRCVTLGGARRGTTLVWRSGQTAWDPDARQIVFQDATRGTIRLSSGDRVVLGGAGLAAPDAPDQGAPQPTWLVPADPSCPARMWVVHSVVPQGG